MPFPPLSRDGRLLFASCGARSFAYGFLSVILGLYLDAIGLSATAIGWVFAAALAGSAVMTILITAIADRFGRKLLLMVGAMLMALAGCVFALSDNPVLLTLAAVFGTISPSGKEVGPFLSLEQAILPQTTGDPNRTAIFSAYNIVASFAGALGALAVSLPSLFALTATAGYRLLVWCCVGLAVLLALVFALLSSKVEAATKTESEPPKLGLRKSLGIVAILAGLFALDAFAGAFIVPFLLAGGLKISYDLWIFAVFRTVKPPEENG